MRGFRSNKLSRPGLTASLALALAACADVPAPPPATVLPAATASASASREREHAHVDALPPTGLDGGAVRAYLVSQYGALAQLSGDWPGVPQADGLGNAAALREVCARETVGSAEAPAELVAVCGMPDDAGHVTTALLDLFLLRHADGQLAHGQVEPTARQHMDAFGSNGDIAGITVRSFGPRLHGFVVEDGFTGQGITIASTHIVLPGDGGFRHAATLRSSLDNTGAMQGCALRGDCLPDAAFDVGFTFDIDDRDATAATWPLRVRERGEACGWRIDRTHLVPFDAASGTWQVPAELQREACD